MQPFFIHLLTISDNVFSTRCFIKRHILSVPLETVGPPADTRFFGGDNVTSEGSTLSLPN